MRNWFTEKFFPSFTKGKVVTITERQAWIFRQNIRFTAGRICYTGMYNGLCVTIRPINSRFSSLIIEAPHVCDDTKKGNLISQIDAAYDALEKAEESGDTAECERQNLILDELEEELRKL